MATLAPPIPPVAFVVSYDRPSYGTGSHFEGTFELHGEDLKFIRHSMDEIQRSSERRAARFLNPVFDGDLPTTYNSVPPRRRYTVQAVFNYRGRARPAPFDLSSE